MPGAARRPATWKIHRRGNNMIDKSVLGRQIIAIVGLALLCAIFGKDSGAVAMSGAAILLFAIYQSIGPPQIPKRTLRFFTDGTFLGAESTAQWTDFINKNENDPEFATVLAFLARLSPEQFLTFVRTIIEFRYNLEQGSLSSVARYLRKHNKRGGK
jgi:hypothetical protein